MKIDLHVHTVERSACAHASEDEQIAAAIERGLDALVFTDHVRLVPRGRLEELNQTYAPFRIFGGIEITVREKEDVLVLGIHDPALESRDWTYPDLHTFVRERGGWIAVAHPFRYHPTINLDVGGFLPDALEGCSINIPPSEQPHIREVVRVLGIRVVCNSDAHNTRHIGVGYNLLEETPVDEAALAYLLRTGAFFGICTMT
jgi:histidinol phosphatase-like PHP family hydrolase